MNEATGLWNTGDCAKKQHFICQYIKGKTASPTPPPPDFTKTGGCQDGWYRYRNRCFLYIGLQKQSDRKIFIDAENDCSTKGGHLASVYDDFYNSFISSNLFRGPSKNVWIGLRFNTLNFASWTDEQHITYTNWGPSEPSKQNSGKGRKNIFRCLMKIF